MHPRCICTVLRAKVRNQNKEESGKGQVAGEWLLLITKEHTSSSYVSSLPFSERVLLAFTSYVSQCGTLFHSRICAIISFLPRSIALLSLCCHLARFKARILLGNGLNLNGQLDELSRDLSRCLTHRERKPESIEHTTIDHSTTLTSDCLCSKMFCEMSLIIFCSNKP